MLKAVAGTLERDDSRAMHSQATDPWCDVLSITALASRLLIGAAIGALICSAHLVSRIPRSSAESPYRVLPY